MALRPPSNQSPRDDYYSRDPALVQLERGELNDAAWVKAQLEHAAKLEYARERADWSALHIAGLTPTKFVMAPLRSTLSRTLDDLIAADKMGSEMAAQIAFRGAIAEISNCSDLAVTFVDHPNFGRLAAEHVVDVLDRIDKGIVGELGYVAWKRARALSPKS